MELRDLTASEMEDFKHIIFNKDEIDTFQILFGIIALDLNITVKGNEKIEYQYLCDNYVGDKPNYGPAAFWGIVETWINETMIYKNIGLVKEIALSTRGLKSNINSTAATLSYTVCHINSGISGKKQVEAVKFFEKVNIELFNSKGCQMQQLPIETFMFIVTCLDYFGFIRKERINMSTIVDVSNIKYEDLV